ncbi:hypothetical protein NC653_031000 [Populus alba x Populus x berolinensis]|uniref:Uncharacterized protein n=1 Tax=Populus alba x Populus x berolinensis TaxID=444605 RepID=A0AAD6LXA9_9ROSI|nr:hypothetical protein NC653_031000 [Populus alba x Populus x berolinensis]
MKFCSSCGKKVSTTREDDEIESCSICGKVLAFPGLRANPLFINGEVVPRLLSKIPSENISRERLYEKGTLMPSSLLLAIAVIIDVIIQDLSRSSLFVLALGIFRNSYAIFFMPAKLISSAFCYHKYYFKQDLCCSGVALCTLEQAARETAAAAAKEAWEENFKNCPEELQAAAKEREAAIENSKSSKINYDTLKKLFEEPGTEDAKKLR